MRDVQPPDDPFAPYVPDEGRPWSVPRANHLFRRFCFGPKREWVESALKSGPAEAIDGIFGFAHDSDPFAELYEQTRGLVPFDGHARVQDWWAHRLVNTRQPLQERVALMWHDHFATGGGKVPPARMHRQINLFRTRGLGSFRTLLVEVGRDPAMLLWLDGNASNKRGPNENYAREVMELFTLGIGNYEERDVKELARCFTGWRIDGEGSRRDKGAFDAGEKTLFGRRGKFDDADACDLLLGHPACAPFVARKLLAEFVHPRPLPEHVEHYAGRLKANDWQIAATLREIVASRLFFSDWAYRAKIKSPADLVIGGMYALGAGGNAAFAREQMNRMGMSLLFPPTVKGWDGEAQWINSNTVLQRFNFGLDLVRQRDNEFFQKTRFDEYLKRHDLTTAERVVDHYAQTLLDGDLGDGRARLVDYMNRNEKNEPAKFEPKGNAVRSKVKGVLHLMMGTPEFQLC